MSLRRRESGKWEFRISYKTPDGKYKQKSKGGFRTKGEASKAEALARAQEEYEEDHISFYDYFKQWMETYKLDKIAYATYRSYESDLQSIKKYFNGMELKQMTPAIYQRGLNEYGETHTASTSRVMHAHIRAMVKYAIHDGIVAKDFTSLATPCGGKASKLKDDKFLEPDELKMVIDECRDKIEFASFLCIYIICKTGVRFAEALGLTWEDIDFDNGQISINKTWDYRTKKGFKKTKTQAGVRIIPVDNDFLETLGQCNDGNKSGRIIGDLANTSVNAALSRTLGRKFNVHGLRHTYASLLIENQIEVLTIAEVLGHENPNVTLSVYSHQFQKLRERETEKIKNIFGQI